MEVLEIPSLPTSKAFRERLFEEFYESAFPSVASFVSQMNGTFQDAKDIFQDALVIFFEKSEDPEFKINTAPERYILGISKHLWIKKFKADLKTISLTAMELSISIPADFFPTPHSRRLLRFLENSGKKCMDLLRGFYYEKQTMKDIAKTLGYSNEHSATVQKYKCLEKIRDSIKEKSISYEDFFE
jgi:DNA-directed RNA polymerase specialized sigma24 family protein